MSSVFRLVDAVHNPDYVIISLLDGQTVGRTDKQTDGWDEQTFKRTDKLTNTFVKICDNFDLITVRYHNKLLNVIEDYTEHH